VYPTITLGSVQTDSPIAAPVACHCHGEILREIEGLEFSAYGVSADAGGLVVSESPSHSAAFASGLHAGDLIQEVNAQPVRVVEEFLALMKDLPNGANIKIIRNQQPKFLDLQLSKTPHNNP
jgi:S1-C subfamily serine protease